MHNRCIRKKLTTRQTERNDNRIKLVEGGHIADFEASVAVVINQKENCAFDADDDPVVAMLNMMTDVDVDDDNMGHKMETVEASFHHQDVDAADDALLAAAVPAVPAVAVVVEASRRTL